MTSPTDLPIEDRLRAHFEDEARRMPIPGPETDTMLAQARDGLAAERERRGDRADRRPGLRRSVRYVRPFLAAAAVVVVVIAAAVVMTWRDDPANVHTDPTPAPTVPGPTTETSAPPSTTTETTAPPPPPLAPAPTTSVVVGVHGILGGWDGTAWVRWNPGDPAPSTRDYQRIAIDTEITTVTGTPSTYRCIETGVPSVDVGLEYDPAIEPVGVAVHGVRDVQPRPVEVLDPVADVYRAAAIEVGAGLGVTQPDPWVVQAVRADLDGDGTTEVIVVAEQMREPGTIGATGDWSAAFVRRVVGGEVRTTMLDAYVVPTGEGFHHIELHRIGAVADLNGDGRMEIVVNRVYYEGESALVYEYGVEGVATEVLSAGCGL